MSETGFIAENIGRVRERMAQAAERSGRNPENICLIGVSKTRTVDEIGAAQAAGVTDFGENYIQEARTKIAAVNDSAKSLPTWHFIGHLQSNKAKYSVELFSVIQTVDNYQLAQELSKQAAKQSKTQMVLIEVNLTGEAARAGVPADNAIELAAQIAGLPNLHLQGLMGMAALTSEAEGARPYFQTLCRLWESLPVANRHILSMGMSNDFEVAIEEGATHIRIGTALFGPRQPA